MVMGSKGHRNKKHCAGKGQQQFTQLTDWEDSSGSSSTTPKALRLKKYGHESHGIPNHDYAGKGQKQFTLLTNRTAGGQSQRQSTIVVTPLTSSKRRPISQHINGTETKNDCAGEGQHQIIALFSTQDRCQGLAVSHQPAMTGTVQHRSCTGNPHYQKLLASKEYIKTQQTGKTRSVL
jgi:hypothetical protein